MTALLLASTSPQRRAILAQLGIEFEAVAPRYEEHDPPGLSPEAAVRAHAIGKARSVAAEAAGRAVLGVDTAVVLDGLVHGKPGSAREAAAVLAALAGRTHEVVSGLCLAGPGFEDVGTETTRVTVRSLTRSAIDAYVATGEWEGRAGGYAIQGRGAALVLRVEGDYLNVVGLPAALLVATLASRLPGGFWLS
ncbi:MAG: septum formation protein Maf [Thermoleophilia bacterium]|nr:septum formation protein Maf [Thermoleophilia bacterium]